MRKIFVNPSVKEIELLGGNVCGSTSGGFDGTNDREGFSENGYEGGYAPVRFDIFNYGGLQ